jgi:hypothetical protein
MGCSKEVDAWFERYEVRRIRASTYDLLTAPSFLAKVKE